MADANGSAERGSCDPKTRQDVGSQRGRTRTGRGGDGRMFGMHTADRLRGNPNRGGSAPSLQHSARARLWVLAAPPGTSERERPREKPPSVALLTAHHSNYPASHSPLHPAGTIELVCGVGLGLLQHRKRTQFLQNVYCTRPTNRTITEVSTSSLHMLSQAPTAGLSPRLAGAADLRTGAGQARPIGEPAVHTWSAIGQTPSRHPFGTR